MGGESQSTARGDHWRAQVRDFLASSDVAAGGQLEATVPVAFGGLDRSLMFLPSAVAGLATIAIVGNVWFGWLAFVAVAAIWMQLTRVCAIAVTNSHVVVLKRGRGVTARITAVETDVSRTGTAVASWRPPGLRYGRLRLTHPDLRKSFSVQRRFRADADSVVALLRSSSQED